MGVMRILAGFSVGLVGLVAPACVVGTERAATRVEVARAPTAGARILSVTGSAPGCAGDAPPPPPRPAHEAGATFIEPDCRFDGVRYAWHPGHWETPLRAEAP
jgi:hypothetical protein